MTVDGSHCKTSRGLGFSEKAFVKDYFLEMYFLTAVVCGDH